MSAPKAQEDPMNAVMAEIGMKEWERYKQDFKPHDKEFIGQASELGSERESDMIRGRGLSELRQQAGPVMPTSRAGMVNRANMMRKSDANIDTSTKLGGLDRKGKGLNTVISLGRNIGTGALGELGRISQINTASQIAAAEARGIKQQGMMDAIGTVAGMGISSYGGGVNGDLPDNQPGQGPARRPRINPANSPY